MLDFTRREQGLILVLATISVILTGTVLYLLHQQKEHEEAFKLERGKVVQVTAQPEKPVQEDIMVHVSGRVKNPGVYRLKKGDRVVDAIQLAGGPLDDADLDAVNMALKVKDEQKIYVPQKGETVAPFQQLSPNQQGKGKININTASKNQLEQLPGIGPGLAERIISYRTREGLFETIQDIKRVPGIGEKRFEDIKELITVTN